MASKKHLRCLRLNCSRPERERQLKFISSQLWAEYNKKLLAFLNVYWKFESTSRRLWKTKQTNNNNKNNTTPHHEMPPHPADVSSFWTTAHNATESSEHFSLRDQGPISELPHLTFPQPLIWANVNYFKTSTFFSCSTHGPICLVHSALLLGSDHTPQDPFFLLPAKGSIHPFFQKHL